MTAADAEKGPQAEPAAKRADARQARSAARLAAVQALYQIEMTSTGWRGVVDEFEAHRLGAEIEGAHYVEADRTLFRKLVEGVVARQRDIDPLTHGVLVAGWPLKQIDPTLRAIFRCAGCEFVAMPSVPPRVTITEYVEVAKAFFGEGDVPRFVNGVLDAMARRVRADEMPQRDVQEPRDVAS